MTVEEAALALGISPDAVRKRLARGRLAGRKVAGVWTVDLDGASDNTTSQTRQPDTIRHASGQELSALVEQLRGENTFLRHQLEEAATERAELRRMLNLEQQTVAALGTPPALTGLAQDVATRPESHDSAPNMAETVQTSPDAAALAAALRDAGVKGKKTRRRLLARLAAAWRGE